MNYLEIDNILDALIMDGVEEIVQYCDCNYNGVTIEFKLINDDIGVIDEIEYLNEDGEYTEDELLERTVIYPSGEKVTTSKLSTDGKITVVKDDGLGNSSITKYNGFSISDFDNGKLNILSTTASSGKQIDFENYESDYTELQKILEYMSRVNNEQIPQALNYDKKEIEELLTGLDSSESNFIKTEGTPPVYINEENGLTIIEKEIKSAQ
mgnify:CR=1 FL=1